MFEPLVDELDAHALDLLARTAASPRSGPRRCRTRPGRRWGRNGGLGGRGRESEWQHEPGAAPRRRQRRAVPASLDGTRVSRRKHSGERARRGPGSPVVARETGPAADALDRCTVERLRRGVGPGIGDRDEVAAPERGQVVDAERIGRLADGSFDPACGVDPVAGRRPVERVARGTSAPRSDAAPRTAPVG